MGREMILPLSLWVHGAEPLYSLASPKGVCYNETNWEED